LEIKTIKIIEKQDTNLHLHIQKAKRALANLVDHQKQEEVDFLVVNQNQNLAVAVLMVDNI
jgi:hypothetical protein